MKENKDQTKIRISTKGPAVAELPGYPPYPAAEDIYNRFHEEADLDPERIQDEGKASETDGVVRNHLNQSKEDKSGNDLDVPGAELDDLQEAIGSEDEENNYYSFGGDGHSTLDENQGE
ncbi:MAG: hypothetical protein FD166_1997 [Bacteroidetes bacterium]|nr:MAG: hypothetical protein FD166_1997 [Bacteroidota bacterium]